VSHYYLDASALVKRYVDEVGSDWLRTIIASDQPSLVFASRLAIVEVISSFARRAREGSLSSAEFAMARDAFRCDCLNEYQVMPPAMTVIDLACVLLERHPLRAYDAIHLATALGAQRFLTLQGYPALILISADDRLNSTATVEGLVVDNPSQHT
jgi:predicted nucleic acid-binding protein